MATLTRLMIAVGAVAASVGFTLLGMALSYISPDPTATRNWIILTIVGLLVLIAGFVGHRGVEASGSR
jgi:hypothetical protein